MTVLKAPPPVDDGSEEDNLAILPQGENLDIEGQADGISG